jgi:hypothetical protein
MTTATALSTTDWATVGTAAFAAVAAIASWASVLQTRRERLAAQRPDLLIEVSVHLPEEKVFVQIHNNGGTARSVRFCTIEGTLMAYGTPQPTGILQRGESRSIETSLPATKDREAKAWISGVDAAARTIYVASSKGKTKRYKLKKLSKDFTDAQITEDLYGIPPKTLSPVSHKTLIYGD